MLKQLLVASLLLAPLGAGQAQSLELVGEQGAAKTLAIAELSAVPQSEVLPEKDGPFRVVMPGEEHRARWIRMVQRVCLVRVGS